MLIAALLTGAVAIVWRLSGVRRQAGLAAVAMLALAFLSPLCGLTTALFAARAVHHVLLIAVVAPLLAVAFPARFGLTSVPLTLAASTAALWAWHWPPAYAAALGNVGIYWAMQAALVASAWAFWNAVRIAAPLTGVAGIIGGAVQMGFLGALLTFAARPLYAAHEQTTAPFGIGHLADQQYAGLIMWVPGMLPYALAAGWLAIRRWSAMNASGQPAGTPA